MSTTHREARNTAVGLTAIVAVTGALRFFATDGWPHPDEQMVLGGLANFEVVRVSSPVVAYGGGYFHPLGAWMNLWREFLGPESLQNWHSTERGNMLLVARQWSALLSTITPALTFVVGRRVFGPTAGLLAALFVAAAPLATKEAQIAKADSAAAFVAAVALVALTHEWTHAVRRALALGLVGGVLVSTKYLVGFGPAVLFGLLSDPDGFAWPRSLRNVAIAVAAAVSTFLLLNPHFVTAPSPSWFFLDSVRRSQFTWPQQDGLSGFVAAPWIYHPAVSLWAGCGAGFTLLAAPALAWGFLGSGARRVVAIAVLGHCIVLLANPLTAARNFLPALPGLAALVGGVIVAAASRLSRSDATMALLAATFALVITARPLSDSMRYVRLLSKADTRAVAAKWIEENVEPGVPIRGWGTPAGLVQRGLPRLRGRQITRAPRTPAKWRRMRPGILVHHRYPLAFSRVPLPAVGHDLLRLAAFSPAADELDDAVFADYASYLPISGFGSLERPGPWIEIYATRGHGR